jgi:hypothetical protein
VINLLLAVVLQSAPIPPAYMATRPHLDVAFVIGTIDSTFSGRLKTLVTENPQVKIVEIESLGGLASQAYEAAEIINLRGIEVRVRGRCASACSLFWSSANGRSMVEGARIGLHAGELTEQPPLILRGVVSRHHERRKTEAYTHAGFPPRLIAEGLSTPHKSMLWFTATQLQQSGVRFNLLPKKPIGKIPPTSSPSPD